MGWTTLYRRDGVTLVEKRHPGGTRAMCVADDRGSIASVTFRISEKSPDLSFVKMQIRADGGFGDPGLERNFGDFTSCIPDELHSPLITIDDTGLFTYFESRGWSLQIDLRTGFYIKFPAEFAVPLMLGIGLLTDPIWNYGRDPVDAAQWWRAASRKERADWKSKAAAPATRREAHDAFVRAGHGWFEPDSRIYQEVAKFESSERMPAKKRARSPSSNSAEVTAKDKALSVRAMKNNRLHTPKVDASKGA